MFPRLFSTAYASTNELTEVPRRRCPPLKPIRPVQAGLEELRLRLLFERLHAVSIAVLFLALLTGLAASTLGQERQFVATQMVGFFLSSAAGLAALSLAGLMWSGKKSEQTTAAIAALVLAAVVIYFTGGSHSRFASLPLVILVLDAPFHANKRVWLLGGVAAAALAAPLAYDFQTWYLGLAIFGWGIIALVTYYATGVITMLRRQRYQTRELAALAQASHLTTSLNLEATLAGTVKLLKGLLEPHACVLYLADPEKTELTPSHMYFDPEVYSPERAEAVAVHTAKWGSGLVGGTARDGQPLISRDVSTDPRAVHIMGTANDPATYLIVPLRFNEETLGVLRVSKDGANQYDNDDLTLATIFANQAAVAIANAGLFEKTRRAEQAARESEQQYVRLTRNAGEVILQISLKDNRVTYINESGEHILGYTREEFRSDPGLLRQSMDDASWENLAQVRARLEGGEDAVRDVVLSWTSKDRRLVILDHVMMPFLNEREELVGVESIARDVTERHRMESEIRQLTFNDQLTGIYNRAYFEQELRRLDSSNCLPLTIILGDINGLKLVNDAFGHQTGDLLLAKAANLLSSVLRRTDVICRWGGDEFAMILPGVDEQAATEIMFRIRSGLRRADPKPIPLSIALGMCTKVSADQGIQDVIREAEERMYRNKLLESKSTHSSIIASLEKTLWEKTHETEEHARRMQEVARALGVDMGLSEDQLTNLSLLAILHDVGKVAIPDDILVKPGQLTAEEWQTMKRHPEIGYRIAVASANLAPIADLILSHHEHWDGTGYPRGLVGEDIPLLARIIAVADAYDVMTSGRPYRRALTEEEAMAELQRCSGTQFDPAVVSALLSMGGARAAYRQAVGGWHSNS